MYFLRFIWLCSDRDVVDRGVSFVAHPVAIVDNRCVRVVWKVKDTSSGEVSDVLLACHHPCLSQHGLRCRRASWTAAVPHRLFMYDHPVNYILYVTQSMA